jgi:putative hydrolase of the HAD superfamily
MKIRAIIFDIYHTLLEIGPPPADAEALWTELYRSALHAKPRLNLNRFSATCQKVIAREHAEARKSGVAYPEIFWPAVVCEALPELACLKPNPLNLFLVKHAALQRSVRLMPGAAAVLRALCRQTKLLGLASNSQPYTLAELDRSLARARLSRKIFKRELNFFSFEAGFSKPDPHVFRWLAARLSNFGVAARETLIVGDRLDNDIEPAHAQRFQTWHLTAGSFTWPAAGDWKDLSRHLQSKR